MLRTVLRSLAAIAILATGTVGLSQDYLDPQLPAYRPINTLEGELSLVGSDTMSQVAALWADRFMEFYPEVKIKVTVKGATNAIPSVLNGEATIGMLSREATTEEVTQFTKTKGYGPKLLVPTLERIGVYVHEDNPVESLTLAQVDAIFSKSRKRGAAAPITKWGETGVSGELSDQLITLLGRSDTTGSQVFFQTLVLQGDEFRPEITSEKDNLTLVKKIAADPTAIGFSGEMYQLPGIKAVSIAVDAESPTYAIDTLGDENGTYPLIRPLQLVIDQAPTQELPEVEREFLRYVFSHSGQEDVVKAGFHPISASPARTALGAVGLNSLN